MTTPEGLRQDYRAALLRYLPRRQEAALHIGYELGRSAITRGFALLELAQIHHDVSLDILRDTRDAEVSEVAVAIMEFFLEVLAPYDMAQRGYLTRPGVGAKRSHEDAERPRT